jgi:hypothetical protein
MKIFKYILVTLSLVLVVLSCKKEVAENITDPALIVNQEKYDVLKEANKYGNMVYEHYKFNVLTHTVDDYISDPRRGEAKAELVRNVQEYDGLSVDEMLSKALLNKRVSQIQANYLKEWEQLNHSLNGRVGKISDYDIPIKSFEQKLAADKAITDDEKLPILAMSCSLRRYFELKMESLRTQSQAKLLGCAGGIDLDCAVVNGVKLALALIPGGSAIKVILTIFGAAISFSNCGCTTPPNTPANCWDLQGIAIIIDPKDPCARIPGNIKFAAYGTGLAPQSYHFQLNELNIKGDVVRTIADAYRNKPSIQFDYPLIGAGNHFGVTVTASAPTPCKGTAAEQSRDIEFDLYDLFNGAGEVFISSGTGTFTLPVGSMDNYYINGTCLIRPLNQFSWYVPSTGIILITDKAHSYDIQNNTHSLIKWVQNTLTCCGGFAPNATVKAVNDCSGDIREGYFTVRTY